MRCPVGPSRPRRLPACEPSPASAGGSWPAHFRPRAAEVDARYVARGGCCPRAATAVSSKPGRRDRWLPAATRRRSISTILRHRAARADSAASGTQRRGQRFGRRAGRAPGTARLTGSRASSSMTLSQPPISPSTAGRRLPEKQIAGHPGCGLDSSTARSPVASWCAVGQARSCSGLSPRSSSNCPARADR